MTVRCVQNLLSSLLTTTADLTCIQLFVDILQFIWNKISTHIWFYYALWPIFSKYDLVTYCDLFYWEFLCLLDYRESAMVIYNTMKMAIVWCTCISAFLFQWLACNFTWYCFFFLAVFVEIPYRLSSFIQLLQHQHSHLASMMSLMLVILSFFWPCFYCTSAPTLWALVVLIV